eukprot:TRINITY_DN26031_c0_g1_i1.p1 TRINITY_DN26031_c0_g1~~TRINITY_DN26031_c0_g1_i1.p1  ORF type:complete len:579 (+),score=183.66 TRINITY_DN26031_c0_g1_i1:120-1856(+)
MGNANVCCTSGDHGDHDISIVPCCGSENETKSVAELPEEVVTVHSIQLGDGDDADGEIADCLEELRDAVRLFREGMVCEAHEKFEKAQEKLQSSPSSRGRNAVMEATEKDPELKDLKLLMRSSINAAAPEAAEEDDDGDDGGVLGAFGFFLSDKKETKEEAKEAAAEAKPAPSEVTPTTACTSAEASDLPVGGDMSPANASAEQAAEAVAAAGEDEVKKDEELEKRRAAEEAEEAQLRELEASFTTLREELRLGKVFEAHDRLQAFEKSLAVAKEVNAKSKHTKVATGLASIEKKLTVDPMFSKLRVLQPRMQKALDQLQVPEDNRGVFVDVKDAVIGPNFHLRIQIRFAEGAERVKKGAATQLIIRGDMKGFPAPLSRAITENCETDLFKPEWVKDCKKITGKPGRPARLYSSLMHIMLSPSLLPFKVEDVVIREVALCDGKGAMPERGPGVLVVEHRPPDGVSDFEGMPVPPKSSGVVRLKGENFFYKTQSEDPNCMDLLCVAKLSLPVPQALLPLSLLKRFAADLFTSSIKLTKVGLYDKWDEFEYKDRVDKNGMKEFFEAVYAIPPKSKVPANV